MEPKVIEEIAEQLGMAVGEAAKFIEDILPQYAGLQVVDNIVPAVISLAACVACVFAIKKNAEVIKKAKEKYKSNEIRWYSDYCSATGFPWAVVWIAAFVLLVAVFVFSCSAGDAIGWALFPDAKLLDMAVKAVM